MRGEFALWEENSQHLVAFTGGFSGTQWIVAKCTGQQHIRKKCLAQGNMGFKSDNIALEDRNKSWSMVL